MTITAPAAIETEAPGPTVERVRLWGFSETIETPVRSMLFGELVRRSAPHLQHYHSDLFHDADWLTKSLNGPMTFFWTVRTWGTHIHDDFDLALAVLGVSSDVARFYRVDVVCERHDWSADFTRLIVPFQNQLDAA